MSEYVVRTVRPDHRRYAAAQPGMQTGEPDHAKVFTNRDTAHAVAKALSFGTSEDWEVAHADGP